VEHACTSLRLLVELRGRTLYLAVDDEMGGPAPAVSAVVTTAKRTGLRSVVGQPAGLRLVNETASRWGWREGEAGKTVWAEVLL